MSNAAAANQLDALLVEIQALRQEVAELRQEVQALRAPAALPSSWLQRRNAERLALEVQRRQDQQLHDGGDAEPDTELDLLIDRLHDLALHNGD